MTDVKKPLTDHEAYFERYGEHLSAGSSRIEAWENTERDLFRESGGVYRRYLSFKAFQVALCHNRKGKRPFVVSFRYVEYFNKKTSGH